MSNVIALASGRRPLVTRKRTETIGSEGIVLFAENTGDHYDMLLAFGADHVSVAVWVDYIRSILLPLYGQQHRCHAVASTDDVEAAASDLRAHFIAHAVEAAEVRASRA